MNRVLEFGFAPGVTEIGSNDIGKVEIKGPPLKKGDVTANGQVEKQDGYIVAVFHTDDVIWNSKVRAFQLDIEKWRIHLYPMPTGTQICRVLSKK